MGPSVKWMTGSKCFLIGDPPPFDNVSSLRPRPHRGLGDARTATMDRRTVEVEEDVRARIPASGRRC